MVLREVKHNFFCFHQVGFKVTKFIAFQQALRHLEPLIEAYQEGKNQAGKNIFYHCLKTRNEVRGHIEMKICE